MARVRTAAAHAVVVPRGAACSNPGCRYPGYPERLKDCCVRDPDHPPPHDTSDPLRGVRHARPARG